MAASHSPWTSQVRRSLQVSRRSAFRKVLSLLACPALTGKMLKDFGVATGSDWTGVPDIMRQELRGSGSADEGSTDTIEYRVIAASLEAIPRRDRAKAKQVFQTFALVAEDTHVPLAAFRILLSALTGDTELMPELALRKYMQTLINRSLVLGTWERPQLHDSELTSRCPCLVPSFQKHNKFV